MSEPLNEALLEQLKFTQTEFAKNSGEIFRTVINLETSLSLISLKCAEAADLAAIGSEEQVLVSAPFVKGLPGQLALLLDKAFTARIVDYMIMGDGEVEFMAEEHLDGIVEAVNQLLGSELTELSARTGVSLRNEVKPARLISPEELSTQFAGWWVAAIDVHIDGRDPVRIHKLFSPDLAQRLAEMLAAAALAPPDEDDDDFKRPAPKVATPAMDTIPPVAPAVPPAGGMAQDGASLGAPAGMITRAAEPQREARQAQFTDFGSQRSVGAISMEEKLSDRGLGRVLDLRLPVVIELGRTHMLIKDIVELSPGSIIELNKLVGEPVDLYVNGKRFAQGEVVVIDENFGVRVTDLVPMEQRMRQAEEG